eukprot:3673748-Rhodomonas_salina.1
MEVSIAAMYGAPPKMCCTQVSRAADLFFSRLCRPCARRRKTQCRSPRRKSTRCIREGWISHTPGPASVPSIAKHVRNAIEEMLPAEMSQLLWNSPALSLAAAEPFMRTTHSACVRQQRACDL